MKTVRNIIVAVDPDHQHSQSLPEKKEIRAVSLYRPVSPIPSVTCNRVTGDHTG
jgi:hypothetical protein